VRTLIANGIYILIVGAPVLLLKLVAYKSSWVNERKEMLSIVFWIIGLALAGWFAIANGYGLNPRLLER
jgi:hypothetical protein